MTTAYTKFGLAAAFALFASLYSPLLNAATYSITVNEGGFTHIGSFAIPDALVGAGNENGFVDFDSFTSLSIDIRGENFNLTHREQSAVGVTLDGSGNPLYFDDRDGTFFADFTKIPFNPGPWTYISFLDFDLSGSPVFGFAGRLNGVTDLNGTYFIQDPSVAPVPLPAAFPLFTGGLAVLGLLGWRRKRTATA